MELAAPGQLRIGDALVAARARAGIDLKQVEAKTKIRAKYLHALEEEDWETLPSPAHAKGFLRTYAELLELDAELLVDEFRRQVESGDSAGPLGSRLLERRRGQVGADRRPLWHFALPGLGAIALIIGAIGLAGGEEDHLDEPSRKAASGGPDGTPRGDASGEGEAVRLTLMARTPVEVCLVGGQGNPLIDGQLLAAGSREQFRGRGFSLRFPSGYERSQLELALGGERVALPAGEGPTAFEIAPPRRVREASSPGRRCP